MSEQRSVALVTGASRGIGAAIAQRLAQSGWTVIGTATSTAGAEHITQTLEAQGGRGAVLQVTDTASVEALFADLQRRQESIEVLVHNAGITRDNLLLRMKPAEWDDVLATNLTAVVRITQRALKDMTRARRGRILLVGSVVGAMGNAGQTNYAAAKAGMAGFARSLAREVGSRNITVNVVAPGFIDTDMTRALGETARGKLLDAIPLGRLGQPEDVAAVVDFLASAPANYITGETIHVNGGMYMQ
jgi:3-oxoacyl-[acyl-carrier protein] reductase